MSKHKIIYRKKNTKFYSLLSSYLKKIINNQELITLLRQKKILIISSIIYRVKVLYYKISKIEYINLPPNHIYSFIVLQNFLKIFEKKNIKFFLLAGTLLGSVRHESFAGRPNDIDFGITEDDYEILKNNLYLTIQNGVKNINIKTKDKDRKYDTSMDENNIDRIQFNMSDRIVDISIFKKIKIKNNFMWLGEVEKNYGYKFNGLLFEINDLKKLKSGKLYGKNFLIPNNAKKYLKKRYGHNWSKPDNKQFKWKELKF